MKRKSASVSAAETRSNQTREWKCRTCDQVFTSMSEFCVHEVSHLSLLNPALAPSIANAYLEQAERIAGQADITMEGKKEQPGQPSTSRTLRGRVRVSSLRASVADELPPQPRSPRVVRRRKHSSLVREDVPEESAAEVAEPVAGKDEPGKMSEGGKLEPEPKRRKVSGEDGIGTESRRPRARIPLPPPASALKRGRLPEAQSTPRAAGSPRVGTKAVARKPELLKSVGSPIKESADKDPLAMSPKPVRVSNTPSGGAATPEEPKSARKPVSVAEKPAKVLSAAKYLMSARARREKARAAAKPQSTPKAAKSALPKVESVAVPDIRECSVLVERLKSEEIEKWIGMSTETEGEALGGEALTVGSIRITRRPKEEHISAFAVTPRLSPSGARRTYQARESKKKGILRQVRAEVKQQRSPSCAAGWYFSEFKPSSPEAGDVFDRVVNPPSASAESTSAAEENAPRGNESLGAIEEFLLETADRPGESVVPVASAEEDVVTTTTVTAADSTVDGSEQVSARSVESNDSDAVDSTTSGMVAVSPEEASLTSEEVPTEQDMMVPEPEEEMTIEEPKKRDDAQAAPEVTVQAPREELSVTERTVPERLPAQKVVKTISYKVDSLPEVPQVEEITEPVAGSPPIVQGAAGNAATTSAQSTKEAPKSPDRLSIASPKSPAAQADQKVPSPSISATVALRHRAIVSVKRRCACCRSPEKKPVDEYEFVDEDPRLDRDTDDGDMTAEDSDSEGSWRDEVMDDSPSPPPPPAKTKARTNPRLPRIVDVKSGISSDMLTDDVLRMRCTLDSRGICVACDQIRKAEDERERWEQRPVDVPDSAAEEVLDWLDGVEPIVAAPLPEFASTTPPLYALKKAEDFALIENRLPADMVNESVVAAARELVAKHEEETSQSFAYLEQAFGKIVKPHDGNDHKAKDKEAEEHKGAYKCPSCESTFKAPIHVATHMWLHHKDASGFDFHCKNCTLNFARKSMVIRHVLQKKFFAGYACNVGKHCKQNFLMFPTKEALEAHKRAKHGFTCDICGNWIAGLMYKKTHMARHAKQAEKKKLKMEKLAEKRLKRQSMPKVPKARIPKPPKSPKRKPRKSTEVAKPSMPILDGEDGLPSPKIVVRRKSGEEIAEKVKKKRGRKPKIAKEREETPEVVLNARKKNDLYCSCCQRVFKHKQALSLHRHYRQKAMRQSGLLPEESEDEIDEAELEKNELYCKCCKKVFKHKQALSLHRSSKKRKGEMIFGELGKEQEAKWLELQRLIEEDEENELRRERKARRRDEEMSIDEETHLAIAAVEAAYSSSSGANSPAIDVFEGLVGRDGRLSDFWGVGLVDPSQVKLRRAEDGSQAKEEEEDEEEEEEEEDDESSEDDEDSELKQLEQKFRSDEELEEEAEEDDDEELRNIAWMQVADLEDVLIREELERAERAKREDEDDEYEGLYIHEGDASEDEAETPKAGKDEELPETPRVFVFSPSEGEVDIFALQEIVYKDEKEVKPICIADFRSLVLGDENMQEFIEVGGEEIVIHGFP